MSYFTLVVGFAALFFVICALIAALALLLYLKRRLQPPPPTLAERVELLEDWMADELKSRDLQERGRTGGNQAQENRIERNEVVAEGRKILLGKGTQEQKKEGLIALIRAHPRVAEAAARKLNRELGVSRFLGMSEDDLLAEVASILHDVERPSGASGTGGAQGAASGW